MRPLGIYFHVPYCVRRCPYCGFYSNAAGSWYDIEDYFNDMKRELEVRARDLGSSFYVDSIYFGGGTPSLASPDLIGGMIDRAASLFSVSSDCEISMEANPGTLEDGTAGLREYRRAGVNRLSIGVQSFDDGVLKTLGRIHTAEDARKGFDDARAAGFDNVSMDLMFGVPGQTEEIWESTLAEAVSMLPDHMSFYSLQIEEGTRFYREYKMGDMTPVTDEEDRRMYHDAIGVLRDHGILQYEISNAAVPGRECRHNLKYWTFMDYLGIGASASSFVSGVRRTDPGPEYRNFAASGFPEGMLPECHVNSALDSAADYMITGLRLTEGVSESDFSVRFGKTIWEMFPDAAADLEGSFASGDIVRSGGRLRIMEKGFDISNCILEAFV